MDRFSNFALRSITRAMEQQPVKEGGSTARQSEGQFAGRRVQAVASPTRLALSQEGFSQEDGTRSLADLQPVTRKVGILGATPNSGVQASAAMRVEDDDDVAARRFGELDERLAQPERITSSINAYNTRRDERAIAVILAGRDINNNESVMHNERMERFSPLGQQLAKKAVEFTERAIHLAEGGSTLQQPALHALARHYDDLATAADRGVADFKKRLSRETISERDLKEVTESYQELVVQAETLEGFKNNAENGIQFSKAAQMGSNSASALDTIAASIPYDRLADYCFRMVENPRQITPEEQEHYDPMVGLASQALKARNFGDEVLATLLGKNIQTQEALVRCTARREQSSGAPVKEILSQALMARIAARSSRNEVIKTKSLELEHAKALAATTTDEEFTRALLRAEQNEEYQKASAEELQTSSSSSARPASPLELTVNADRYDQVALGFERAATCQEGISALPDVLSAVKGQKPLKERAQLFLNKAQEFHRTALEQLQKNNVSAEDSLHKAGLELDKVEKAVEAARGADTKARTDS